MGEEQEIVEEILDSHRSQEQATETMARGEAGVRGHLLACVLAT